jgi:ABC-type uncharacterized transport system substrate-binding protein
MRRRDFIKLVIGSGSTLPLSVNAQQPKGWRVGFLHPGQSALVSNRVVAFREGLAASAADAEIIIRLANEQIEKLPAMALDLVRQGVQAFCAVSPPAVRAAQEITQSIPIVAMDLESDPVANGWAASLAHPGASPLFGGNPQLLADLALQNRLPAINIYYDFAQRGGLIGYGPELQILFMQSGVLVRKILQGSSMLICQSSVQPASSFLPIW